MIFSHPPTARSPSVRTIALTTLSLIGFSLLRAAPDTAPAPTSPPPTANYTDNPPSSATTYTTYNDSSYYSNGYNYNSSYFGGSPFSHFDSASFRTQTSWRQRIFFPGSEPALGQVVPRKETASRGYNVPAKLETYIGEPFFAPLSAHLFDEGLSKRRQQRIDTYRADKRALLVELRTVIERTKNGDPAARATALKELASRQDGRIEALEETGEQIRDDLTRGGFFKTGVAWNEYRSWRLGDDARYESSVDEFKVARGAVYFQRGLSAAQRRLLREIALELSDAAFSSNDPTADIALDAPAPYYFFSPATSRIRLPLDLPADLLARLDEYRSKKDALKQDLRETLYRGDRAWLDSTRMSALAQLAEKQAPLFKQIDMLAESLRRDLARYPYPDEPAKSILSDDLMKRISAYLKSRADLQRDLVTRLQEVRTSLPTDRVEFERKEGASIVAVVPNRSASSAVRKKRETLLSTLPAFNEEKSAIYRTLDRQRTTLREEVAKTTLSTARGTGKSLDELLNDFARSFEKQELWNDYREYRIAVLEPDLSPQQRRLLYDAALEELMAYSPLSRL